MNYFVTARIWEPVREQGRAVRYELPLSSVLRSYKLGEVIDRGCMPGGAMGKLTHPATAARGYSRVTAACR